MNCSQPSQPTVQHDPGLERLLPVVAVSTHPDALISEIEAAQLLNLSVRTLQAWRARGEGCRWVRISARCVKYRVGDIRSFITERVVEGGAMLANHDPEDA